MAIQIQRGPKAALPSIHDTNLKLLTDASNLASDTGWLAPGAALLLAGSTLVAVQASVPGVSIPQGGQAFWAIRPQPSWNSHQLALRAVYSDTSGSAAAFGVTWTAAGISVGQAGQVTIGTSTTPIPGVTPSGSLAAIEVTINTTPILATMETLGILLFRAASDAQGAAPLYLYGLQWRVYQR